MMTVTVEFISLPNVVKMIGAKSVAVEFDGGAVADLVSALVARHGERLGRFLCDENGELDPAIRVRLGDAEWLGADRLERTLRDGDRVTLAMLVGGG